MDRAQIDALLTADESAYELFKRCRYAHQTTATATALDILIGSHAKCQAIDYWNPIVWFVTLDSR
jgi:hypothetical protein